MRKLEKFKKNRTLAHACIPLRGALLKPAELAEIKILSVLCELCERLIRKVYFDY
ncbi:hypothetical protein D1BOALGB6SA_7417 [Olavius sp. associated proteobacterium Delta 1]|nr:hypothetical protein D1BOALGB6SA_7417 [Olavius sp. associated proteobacterium Delta 1]